MGESNDSFFENILLKTIDEEIPISVDVSKIIKSTISKSKKHIDKSYVESVKSELKKEILFKLRHRFSAQKKENEHLEEFIQRINDQISTLKSEINFLREKLKLQSCKLYVNKYMIASTQITNTFIAVLVFKLLSRKVLFISRKGNRNC